MVKANAQVAQRATESGQPRKDQHHSQPSTAKIGKCDRSTVVLENDVITSADAARAMPALSSASRWTGVLDNHCTKHM